MVAHYYHRKTNWKCLFYLRKLKTYLKKDQNNINIKIQKNIIKLKIAESLKL